MLNCWQNAADAGKRNIFLICQRDRRLAHKGDISGSGELILIPPQSPHSCNPLHERPRSYHMLYLDADWCLTQLPHL
ncbi:AraC family ligand binding domain-containing protein, partial [Salmonella enterica subsp. enterica serovar Cerro]|nr:AraC family ligand binding domain-containing protein [Salmonella enterica subsp. enterica serovar Cerro]